MVSTGCTSGIDAVGYARRADPGGRGRRHDRRRDRRADLADHRGLLRRDQGHHRRATTTPSTPRGPFDATRDGFVLGEGARRPRARGAASSARRRGAHIYAEIAGFATRCNAFHMTGLRPDGRGDGRGDPRRAGRGAASTPTTSTTSTRTARAPSRTTGTRPPRSSAASASTPTRTPVSSIKSMVGHSLGAIGSIEIAACALAIEHGVVPPTANLREPRSGVRPRLRAAHRARDGRSTPCCPSAAASAASSRAMVLTRPRCGVTDDHAIRRRRARHHRHRRGRAQRARHRGRTGRRRCEGRSGIGRDHALRPVAATRHALAGEVDGFDPRPTTSPGRLLAADRPLDPAGAGRRRRWPLDDAGFDPGERPTRTTMGVITGQPLGRQRVRPARDRRSCGRKGAEYVSAYQSIAWFYAVNTGQISIRHGMQAARAACVVTEQARRAGRARAGAAQTPQGHAGSCVTGGVDGGARPVGAGRARLANGRLSAPQPTRTTPTGPSTRRANGYVVGEGGAILLLEDGDAARARGARQVYGEVAGYGATHDAHHHGTPPPTPTQYARAIRLSLTDAGSDPRRRRRGVRRRRRCPGPGRARGGGAQQVFGGRGHRGAGDRAADDGPGG